MVVVMSSWGRHDVTMKSEMYEEEADLKQDVIFR